ncbi:MAG: YbaB/EbfC family nucleoid-associated protein [Firmicutes bacterium]|nr:YbaB/EbfC family nucleoid-associated protein [Bacillota bacterium]
MDESYEQAFDRLRQIQSEIERMKAKLRQKTIAVEHGPVRMLMNGFQEVMDVSFAPGSVPNPRSLEDAVKSAVNESVSKSRNMVMEEMSRLMGGMLPPGFGPMFD